MRRFLLITFLGVIFLTPMYSQIQNEFFGYKLGSEVYPLLQYIDNNYKGGFIGPDSRTFYVGKFAGINWNYAQINYSDNIFNNITFTKTFDDKKLAFHFFNNLKNRLDKKYIEYVLEDSSQKVLYDDGKLACLLICVYDELPYRAMAWFLKLYYWDKALGENPIDKQDKDL